MCLCRVDISDTLMYVYEMLGAELLSSLYDKLGRLLTNTEQPSTWQVSKGSWHWAVGCQPRGGAPEGAVLAMGEQRGVMDAKNVITLTCGLSEICWNNFPPASLSLALTRVHLGSDLGPLLLCLVPARCCCGTPQTLEAFPVLSASPPC